MDNDHADVAQGPLPSLSELNPRAILKASPGFKTPANRHVSRKALVATMHRSADAHLRSASAHRRAATAQRKLAQYCEWLGQPGLAEVHRTTANDADAAAALSALAAREDLRIANRLESAILLPPAEPPN